MKNIISLVAVFALLGGAETAVGKTPNTLDKNRILSIIKSASGNKNISYPEPTEQVGEYYTKKDAVEKAQNTTTPPSPFRAKPNPKILPPSTTTSPEVERLSNFGIFVNPFMFREDKKKGGKKEEGEGKVINDTQAQKDETISRNMNLLPSIPPSGSMVYGNTIPNKIVIISDIDNSPQSVNTLKTKSRYKTYSPRGIGKYF